MTKFSGRCLCGAVTWIGEGPLLWAGHCHCESCRRATASPMTSFFGLRRENVQFDGPLEACETSAGQVTRRFCGKCGTQITYQNARWPDETHLYATTLNDPAQFVPQAHYHFAEKVPWLHIDDDLPKHVGSAENNSVSK